MPDAVRNAVVAAPREDAAGLGLPDFDYWLLDETVPRKSWAAVQRYGDRGAWLEADVITDPGFVADRRRWPDAAMSRAIPLDTYMAARSAA